MTQALPPLCQADLDEVLAATASMWSEMRGQRLFLTGGTGFFGCWLVETFLHCNRALGLGAGLTVLTRRPEDFAERCPHLAADPALTLARGDIRDFDFPAGDFRYILHAATEASAAQLAESPDEMRSVICEGSARVLKLALACGAAKLLLTSSGAVYGQQSQDIALLTEGVDAVVGTLTVYGEGKLEAERMCLAASAQTSLECKIARCFAFVGPHLPLDRHFAAGNFLADALAERDIQIASDGSAVRSYLYASDLAIWLWTMLFRAPSSRAYNVGSEEAVNIQGLAAAVRDSVNPAIEVHIAGHALPGTVAARYVPSTLRARTELGLRQTVSLPEALRRTAAWHRLR